jgi:hypothetical protein
MLYTSRSELEFLKRLWGLGTEEEEGYRTGPPGYIGWWNSFLGIDSGKSYTFKTTGSIPYFLTFVEPRNRFQEMNSASLCSLADRYDNPIPTRFLALIDCLKILALSLLPGGGGLASLRWLSDNRSSLSVHL